MKMLVIDYYQIVRSHAFALKISYDNKRLVMFSRNSAQCIS